MWQMYNHALDQVSRLDLLCGESATLSLVKLLGQVLQDSSFLKNVYVELLRVLKPVLIGTELQGLEVVALWEMNQFLLPALPQDKGEKWECQLSVVSFQYWKPEDSGKQAGRQCIMP